MKSRAMVTMLAVVAVLTLGAGAAPARADDPAAQPGTAEQVIIYQCPMHPEMKATWPAKCPKCGMTMTKAEKPEAMMMTKAEKPEAKKPKGMKMPMMAKGEGDNAMAAMMQKMGDMKGMMMKCRMMMGAKLQKTDPAAVLALKDELELSDVQIEAIEKIEASASKQVENTVLTDEQKKKLSAIGGKPESMAEMHARMEKMMKEMMKKMEQKAPAAKAEQASGAKEKQPSGATEAQQGGA